MICKITNNLNCNIPNDPGLLFKPWFVYIIQSLKDNTLYTGITLDVVSRLRVHNEGRGARYTRGRTPFVLLKSFEVKNKSEALKMEYRIKQLSRDEKLNFQG